MTVQEVRTGGRQSGGREKATVLVFASLVVLSLGGYMALRTSAGDARAERNLLPYQALSETLADRDQRMFTAIRASLAAAEAERSQRGQWPEPATLATLSAPAFGDAASFGVSWQKRQQRSIVNYLATPMDAASPAWLLAIQEPEPNTPPDPAPLDDEHHRLPDGTTLHIYVWTHRFGGRVPSAFVAQPELEGWTQVFTRPPNPIATPKKPS